MITIKNITMSYQKGTEIIKSLSLTLQTGTIHGIVGLNGSGKTTLPFTNGISIASLLSAVLPLVILS